MSSDILTIIGNDTILKRQTRAELAGPCPFCGGNDRFRVNIDNDTWWCRQCSPDQRWHDKYEYVKRKFGIGYKEAKEKIDGPQAGGQPQVDPLADYPAAHGCTWAAFASWGARIEPFCDYRKNQPTHGQLFDAIFFPADPYHPNDGRGQWRIFGLDAKFLPAQPGQKDYWYGLKQAAALALATQQPLVIVNGKPSVIACTAQGVAATAIPGGETGLATRLKKLMKELLAVYPRDKPITVLLDGDKTGRQYAPKVADLLRQNGYTVAVKDPGDGLDAADVAALNKGQAVAAVAALADLGGSQSALPATPAASSGGGSIPPTNVPSSSATQASQGQQNNLPLSLRIRDALSHHNYSFRLNDANDKIEVNGETITDTVRAEIRAKMRDEGFRNMGAVEDVYEMLAAGNRYHPLKEYLKGLPWDGLDHIRSLASKLKSSDPKIVYSDGSSQELHYVYIKRWMVGAVAKVLGEHQNMMLVLGGPTNIGKSSLARWLCSGIPKYFIEGPINTDDKDSDVRLMSKFIWEVPEVDATTRRSDASALKAFLTKQHVTVRKSHRRDDTEKPALTSFIGTFNPSNGFLVDDTGNRRFMITMIDTIDFSYDTIDPNQIWAQAVALYNGGNGEPWRLQPDEFAHQTQQNKVHEVGSLLDDYIKQHFSITGDPTHCMSAAEIVDHLRLKGVTISGTMIGLARDLMAPLRRFGAEPYRTATNRGYRKIIAK